MRNIIASYFALSELRTHYACGPGATRLAPLDACPWLSYFAPLALRDLRRRFMQGLAWQQNLRQPASHNFTCVATKFAAAGKPQLHLRGNEIYGSV